MSGLVVAVLGTACGRCRFARRGARERSTEESTGSLVAATSNPQPGAAIRRR